MLQGALRELWSGCLVVGEEVFFFFSRRRRHTRCSRDWSSDVCSSDLLQSDDRMESSWDQVYSQRFMTMWYPNEDIVRFCAVLIQKKLTPDRYEVKRKVERVLDLGCGNGRPAIFFASQGFSASGVDSSEQAIDWAKDWAERERLDVDFRVADILNLPYDDATFDVVVSHGVLDHVTAAVSQGAIREVRRVLKPGGLFYCDLRSTEDR